MASFRYFKGRYLVWLLPAFIISFGASVYGVITDPSATFFLVPTRAWELLAGSILALSVIPDPAAHWQRSLFGSVGLVLIGYGVFGYTEATPFPGMAAVAPVVGSGMIIWSGRGGGGWHPVQSLLTAPILVFTGLISYSLYLWHWPLVAFWKYMSFRHWTPFDSLGVIAVSFIIAVFSWKFIEEPFRRKERHLFERGGLFTAAGLASVCFLLIGAAIHVRGGFPDRFGLSASPSSSSVLVSLPRIGEGVIPPTSVFGDARVDPSFVLWGDSHARAILPALHDRAMRAGVSGVAFFHGGVPAILGVDMLPKSPGFDGALWNERVLAYVTNRPELQTVVLAGMWSYYTRGARLHREDDTEVLLSDKTGSDAGASNAFVLEQG